MHPALRMRQYQQQAVTSSSPDQLVVKLYDLGIAACHRQDRNKLRLVLRELIAALNFDQGGEIAQGLYDLYEYCLRESVNGDLEIVTELLGELRDVWKNHIVGRKAA